LIPVDATLPAEPEILSRFPRRRTITVEAVAPPTSCQTCHPAAHASWSASGHAKRVRSVPDEAPAPPAAAAEEGGAGKRPRLVWSPALHSRFVDAVTHLGIKAAVPKTIMQARAARAEPRCRLQRR
jgi:SHAQKYF class myb-like DNA-binding protein